MKSLGSTLAALLFTSVTLAACGGAAAPAASAPPSVVPASAKPSTPAAGSVSPAASASVIPLKVGFPQASITQGPIFAGVDQGIFKNNGLDVSIQMIGGPQELPALLANEIQIATVGGTEVANAVQKDVGLVMVATIADYPMFSLYVDKKYKSAQDLAGQTIGITAAGSSTDSAARLFLNHFGMQNKVKIAPAGGTQPSILAAMTQGGVAGGILSPPVTDQAAKSGYLELVNGVQLGIPMNTAGVVVTRAYLKDHTDVVKRYVKGYQQAWTYLANSANEAEVIAMLAKRTQSDPATVEPGYRFTLKVWQASKIPAVNPEAITNLLNLSDDPKVRAVKPADIIDNTLLDSVQ